MTATLPPGTAAPGIHLPALTAPPSARDPFVDAARVLGIIGVVLLHWLMAEAVWDGRTLSVGNALSHGSGWILTWLQPLPLLFFAAGAAAAYRRGRTVPGAMPWWSGLAGTVAAAARPVVVLLGVWALAAAVLIVSGVPDGAVWRVVRMVPQPLWFLGVWVLLLAATPLLQTAWRRWRWGAAGVLLAAPFVVDLLRFGAGLESLGVANIVLAWAVPFGAGVAYAADRSDGRRPVLRGRLLCAGAGAAGVVAVLLVAVGPYPASLVGMPGAPLSNLSPPTAPVVAHAVAMVCLVLVARGFLVRWAGGAGRVVEVVGRHAMTVYLWHLTAMFAVVGLVLLGLGERMPEAWSIDWWASRPFWFGASVLMLAVLVRVFGRFEASRAPARPSRVVRTS